MPLQGIYTVHLTGTGPLHHLLSLLLSHAALRNRLEQLFDLWGTVYKFMVPELKCWVFNQLNEGDEKTPRMRPIYNQPFQENPCDLFLDCLSVRLGKKVQHGAAEVVRVAVWVPQLVCNCV